jgi:hypothetical protein
MSLEGRVGTRTIDGDQSTPNSTPFDLERGDPILNAVYSKRGLKRIDGSTTFQRLYDLHIGYVHDPGETNTLTFNDVFEVSFNPADFDQNNELTLTGFDLSADTPLFFDVLPVLDSQNKFTYDFLVTSTFDTTAETGLEIFIKRAEIDEKNTSVVSLSITDADSVFGMGTVPIYRNSGEDQGDIIGYDHFILYKP